MTGQKLHGDEIDMFSAKQIYYNVRGRENSRQDIGYKCVNIFRWSAWKK
jgi:hypothetical protein